MYNNGESGNSDDNDGGRIDGDELYNGRVDPVLDSLSNLYSLLNSILGKS